MSEKSFQSVTKRSQTPQNGHKTPKSGHKTGVRGHKTRQAGHKNGQNGHKIGYAVIKSALYTESHTFNFRLSTHKKSDSRRNRLSL